MPSIYWSSKSPVLLKTEIMINLCKLFQIFVDGKRYGTFAHRTSNPGEDYMALRVAGDFELTGMEFTM